VELQTLMRRVPHGVAVLTVDTGGERLGLTVDSFVSLSLEPPLVGVAVSRQAAMHELVREAGGFALSLLAAGQEGVAQHFARGVPPIAHWHGIPVRADDPRLIDGAAGWLVARTVHELVTGDHTFFVGEVTAIEHGHAESSLVYSRRAYQAL
jgi:flavin reductase (DIM6/NTAB) family NADH-FMN oxidoreductase RutF